LGAGGAGGLAEERGCGFALEFEEAVAAADFGIGEDGERVEGTGERVGAEQLVPLRLGVGEGAEDGLGLFALEDFEDLGDGAADFRGDLRDREGVVEVAGEDGVFQSGKLGGIRLG
jgi:hypothetical protein